MVLISGIIEIKKLNLFFPQLGFTLMVQRIGSQMSFQTFA